MNSKHIIITLLLIAFLAPCVVAVSVTFDNETCGIHVTKNMPVDAYGHITISDEDMLSIYNASKCNWSGGVSISTTEEYITRASSYCASGHCGIQNVTVEPTFMIIDDPLHEYHGMSGLSGNTTTAYESFCTTVDCNTHNLTPPKMYPQEYYTLGKQTSVDWRKVSGAYYGMGQDNPTAQYLTFLELRRQTILMERQNEMVAEQMRWQRNATLKCISYYNRGVCEEYAWVGGA